MKPIKITGRLPDYISSEEVRAICVASIALLGYHGKFLADGPEAIRIYMTDSESLGGNDITGGVNAGMACGASCKIWVATDECPNKVDFTTILIHEMIHLLCQWEGGQEMPTSTLTARLKCDITFLAHRLAKNTYRRAAWIAHGKISYKRAVENDKYNDEQWRGLQLTTNGHGVSSTI